jgi:hypothetical protein
MEKDFAEQNFLFPFQEENSNESQKAVPPADAFTHD